MAFHVSHRYGGDDRDPPLSALPALLAELDDRPEDEEHRDVVVTHESGWSVSVFNDGVVAFENVDELEVEPRHIAFEDHHSPEVLRILEAVAEGRIEHLQAMPWRPGYRP